MSPDGAPTRPPLPFLRAHAAWLSLVAGALAAHHGLGSLAAGGRAALAGFGAVLTLGTLSAVLARPPRGDHPLIRLAVLAGTSAAGLAAAAALGALSSPSLPVLGIGAGLAAVFVGQRAAWALAAAQVLGLTALSLAARAALGPAGPRPAALPGVESVLAFAAVTGGMVWLARRGGLALEASQARLASAHARQAADLATSRAALEAAVTELRLANARLTQFNAAVGHDLKSPLQSIVARMDLLALVAPEQPGRAVALSAEVIDTAERMGVQLDEILKLATMGDRLPDPRPVPLDGPLAEARADLSPAAAALPVLVAGPLPVAQGNGPLLRQLFQNLLENAAKYGARTVRIAAAPAAPGSVGIVVEDDGPGVAPEDRASIFGLFRRPEKHARAPGVGAGLAIVQRILEVHGGHIRIEAGQGLPGARFVVELPAATPPAG